MTDRLSSVALRILGTRETLGELAAIDTTILKNGAIVYVVSVREHFVLLKESTQTEDGAAVVQPVNGPGRWFRESVVWASQAHWYIDAINGDDSNSGLSATEALATLAELERRIGTASLTPPENNSGFGLRPVKVHLLSDMDLSDSFCFRGTFAGRDSYLWFSGEASTVLASGVFASVTNTVVGATRPSVQVTGFDWTPYVSKRVRIVSTAGSTPIGTVFWVEAVDANPEIAYISQAYAYLIDTFVGPWAKQNLAAGDGFVVEELTAVGNISCDTFSENGYQINYGVVGEHLSMEMSTMYMASGHLFGCAVRASFIKGWVDCFACLVGFPDFPTFKQTWHTGPDQNFLTACSIQGDILVQATGEFVVIDNTSMQGARITVEAAFFRVSNQYGGAFMAWDWAGYAIDWQESAQGYLEGLFWGTSSVANSHGILIRSGSVVHYLTANKPTASGTSDDVSVGGTVGSYAVVVPVFNTTTAAGLVERA